MKTSYFAVNATNPKSIAVCRYIKDWVYMAGFDGPILMEVAPPWKIVRAYREGRLSREEYSEDYLAFLNKIAYPKRLIASIPDDAILLCYEAPNQFCHRRLLAKWIEEKSGIAVPEWKTKKQEQEEEQEKINNNILLF
jgi:hypothetical protein